MALPQVAEVTGTTRKPEKASILIWGIRRLLVRTWTTERLTGLGGDGFLTELSKKKYHLIGDIMHPRITISKSINGELELFINEAGRDLLVKSLNELSEENDHFHLSSSRDSPGIMLETKPYNKTDAVFSWAKVLFRPDKWDAEFFPHVFDDQ